MGEGETEDEKLADMVGDDDIEADTVAVLDT